MLCSEEGGEKEKRGQSFSSSRIDQKEKKKPVLRSTSAEGNICRFRESTRKEGEIGRRTVLLSTTRKSRLRKERVARLRSAPQKSRKGGKTNGSRRGRWEKRRALSFHREKRRLPRSETRDRPLKGRRPGGRTPGDLPAGIQKNHVIVRSVSKEKKDSRLARRPLKLAKGKRIDGRRPGGSATKNRDFRVSGKGLWRKTAKQEARAAHQRSKKRMTRKAPET